MAKQPSTAARDRLRKTVAAALDEVTPRNPTVADLRDPRLDEFLTRLEREPNIEAQLGLPERPRNLRIIGDTMDMQESGGAFLNEAEEAANGRMKQEMANIVRKGKPEQKPAAKPKDEMSEEERALWESVGRLAQRLRSIEGGV